MESDIVNNSNNVPNKQKKGCCIAMAAVFVVFIILITFFIILIVKNIKNLNNTNQTANSAMTVATTDDPYKGSADAKVTIVEFGDFQCPYCLQEFPIVREIIDIYGDKIKFIYRDFPLTDTHSDALKAAQAGECAHEQGKFWEMHDKMFINHSDLSVSALKSYAQQIGLDTDNFNNCLDSDKYETEVLADYNEGVDAGVIGTPTFFINNIMYKGAIPLEDFKKIIDTELSRNQ